MLTDLSEVMSAQINEIAQKTESASTITTDAVTQANEASNRVNQLGETVLKIGKITETINEISDQTSLLALNATIEASRAGEAGKGFAVVANEIKGLATQTAEATREISAQIEEIQQAASGSVGEMETISKGIHNVDEIISAITISIEEQSTVIREIAGSVALASQGVDEVNHAVASSVDGVKRISNQMNGIHQAAAEMAYRSSLANLSTEEVSSHKGCEFGRWIDGQKGKALSGNPSFEKVYQTHKKVHQIAVDIVAENNNGNKEKLPELMNAFEETRKRLFTALDELYR